MLCIPGRWARRSTQLCLSSGQGAAQAWLWQPVPKGANSPLLCWEHGRDAPPPALVCPDRCRSPETPEWGIYSDRVRMRFPTSDLQEPSAASPRPTHHSAAPSSARAHRAGREPCREPWPQGHDRFWGRGGHFSRSTRPSQSCPCTGREHALKISLLFLCLAWRIERTMTKAPPAQQLTCRRVPGLGCTCTRREYRNPCTSSGTGLSSSPGLCLFFFYCRSLSSWE